MSNKITQNNVCLTLEMIREYYLHELSPEMIRKVEEHLIDCALCSDLLDGYELVSEKELLRITKEITLQIDSKVKKNSWKTFIFFSVAIFILFSLTHFLTKMNPLGKTYSKIF